MSRCPHGRLPALLPALLSSSVLALALVLAGAPALRAQPPEILDLQDLETLRARFDADFGHPRLILLLSPT